MTLEDRLDEHVKHVTESGDPYAPGYLLEDSDEEIWLNWRIDEHGSTHLEIRVGSERYPIRERRAN